MTLEMMRNDYMDKGREEGRREESERYNKLISFLVRDQNYDAFERMTKDDAEITMYQINFIFCLSCIFP